MWKIPWVGVEVIFILTLTFVFDKLTFIVFFLLSIFINISLAWKLKTQLFFQLKINGVFSHPVWWLLVTLLINPSIFVVFSKYHCNLYLWCDYAFLERIHSIIVPDTLFLSYTCLRNLTGKKIAIQDEKW